MFTTSNYYSESLFDTKFVIVVVVVVKRKKVFPFF